MNQYGLLFLWWQLNIAPNGIRGYIALPAAKYVVVFCNWNIIVTNSRISGFFIVGRDVIRFDY